MRGFTVIDCDQRSPGWLAARIGRATSSRAADISATIKGGREAAGRRNYRTQLVLERLTGRRQERDFVSPAMQQGVDREADARGLFEALSGTIVRQCGFVRHDSLLIGCSPDGVIGDFDELLEAKCPLPATHYEYLTTGIVPNEYLKQIFHQLLVTNARACNFISYNPDFPAKLQLKMVRVLRKPDEMAAHEQGVRLFLDEVERDLAVATKLLEAA